MKKSILFLTISAFLVTIFAAGLCSAKTYRWRAQSAFSRGDFSAELLPEFAAEVKKLSNGRLLIQTLFAGDLVPSDDTFKATSQGIIEMSQTCGVLWSGEEPILGLEFGLPFGFKGSLEDVENLIKETGLYKLWAKAYDRKNVHLLGIHTYGPYPAIASNKPVRSLNDFKGLKVRAILEIADLMKELGASPVYVPGGEIYMSLKLGVFDAATYSIDAIRGFKLNEVIKYYILPYWSDWYFGDVIINNDAWNELPDDLKQVLVKAMAKYGKLVEKAYVDELKIIINQADKLGYEVIKLPKEDVAKIRQIAIDKIWPAYAKKCPDCAVAIEAIKKYHGVK